jgi:hypothetical protein
MTKKNFTRVTRTSDGSVGSEMEPHRRRARRARGVERVWGARWMRLKRETQCETSEMIEKGYLQDIMRKGSLTS